MHPPSGVYLMWYFSFFVEFQQVIVALVAVIIGQVISETVRH